MYTASRGTSRNIAKCATVQYYLIRLPYRHIRKVFKACTARAFSTYKERRLKLSQLLRNSAKLKRTLKIALEAE